MQYPMYDMDEDTYFNGTKDLPIQLSSTLSSYQIFCLIWNTICVIPNISLIWILMKYQLCSSNIYFIIANWSCANILYMMCSTYVVAVPEASQSHLTLMIVGQYSCIISTAPVLFALLFLFDKFVNSRKICRFVVFNVWISSVINMGISTCCILYQYEGSSALTLYSIVTLGFLAGLILIVRHIVFCIKSSEEKNYPLRLAMSYFCILGNFGFAGFLIGNYFTESIIRAWYNAVILAMHTNGLINLLLLVYFDENVRAKVNETLRCRRDSRNVQFTRGKSAETDHLPGSEDGININLG